MISKALDAKSLTSVMSSLAMLLVTIGIGWALSRDVELATLGTLAIVAIVAVSWHPLLGLYGIYAALYVLPYDVLRTSFPIFDSPLQLLAIVSLSISSVSHMRAGRMFPRSNIYIPLILCIVVLGGFSFVDHGEVAALRFSRFVQGLWPLLLIGLMAYSPRHVRNILISMVGSLSVLALLWLPGLLGLSSAASGGAVRSGAEAVSLAGYALGPAESGNTLSYQSLVAMALVAPLLLAIALAPTKWRLPAVLTFSLLTITILLSTYASAVVALGIGVLSLLGATIGTRPLRRRNGGFGKALFLSAIITFVVVVTLSAPTVQDTLTRLQKPTQDVSGNTRLVALREGIDAFVSRPLTGHGAYDRQVSTTSGDWLGGHNTFVVVAYEFGLMLLVPFALMILTVGKLYASLARGARSSFEDFLAWGLIASLVSAVVTGFITPVFGIFSIDTVIWSLVALAIRWRCWQVSDQEEMFPTTFSAPLMRSTETAQEGVSP